MTAFEIISFLASAASLILAIVAIWLSVVFFRMSSEASKSTSEAAKGIAASVDRLEKLFDKLYSDTFSMMRDTVADMRRHMWPTEESEPDKAIEETEKKADAKIGELKKNMEEQLSQVLQRQRMADTQVSVLRGEMRGLIDRAIAGSRQVETEAREETIREYISRELRVLRSHKPRIAVEDVVERLRDRFPVSRVLLELQKMAVEGLIFMRLDDVGPETEISFRPLVRRPVVQSDSKNTGDSQSEVKQ